MLYRLIDPSPRGKREELLRIAGEFFEKGEKILFLVPEQITADYERAILKALGPKSNLLAEVANFSRLANIVLRARGGLAHRVAGDAEKRLIFSHLLRTAPSLFPEADGADPDRVVALYEEMEELRLAGILDSAEALCEGAPEGLQEKLEKFSGLCRAFFLALEETGGKCGDELEYLMSEPERLDFFSDTHILVDGFWDFTFPQEKLLCRLMQVCPSLHVSITAEKGEEGLFAAPLAAARRLYRAAREAGVEVRDLTLPDREEENDRLFAARHLLSYAPPRKEVPRGIRLVSCASPEEESLFIASRIGRLLAEGKRRSDIAVLSRDGAISSTLALTLEERGIPAFCEEKKPLASCSAARTVLLACRIAAGDARESAVRAFLKHALLSHDEEELFLLEKYAATWSLSGSQWIDGLDFVYNPSGYGVFYKTDYEELEKVNRAKHAVFTPLSQLAMALSVGTVAEKVASLVGVLTRLGSERVLEDLAEEAKARGDYDRAGEILRSWNATLAALDELSAALGGVSCGAKEFVSYLELAFRRDLPGAIPPGRDRVQIGLLGLHRAEPKVLFLPDLNAGVFPQNGERMGRITRAERAFLEEKGFATMGSETDRARETFLFYLALTTPSEEICLSFVTEAPEEGDKGSMSVFAGRLCALFPALTAERFDSASSPPVFREDALRYWARHKDKEAPFLRELEEALAREERFARRLAETAAAKAHLKKKFSLESELPFVDSDVRMSYSKLDTYSNCRFSFYAKYLLDAKETGKASFGSNHAGTFVHRVLEKVLGAVTAEGRRLCELSPEELEERGKGACREAMEELACSVKGERIAYLAALLEKSCFLLLRYLAEESAETGFTPIFFEKDLEDLASCYSLPLPDGRSLLLTGDIDRVDLYKKKDGTPFVRVVDYKTGGKEFSLNNVANGLSMQMLLYLFALWQVGFRQGDETVHPLPAGILYLNGLDDSISVKSRKELEEKKEKPYAALSVNGLFLDDEELLAAQDPTGKGKYIPRGVKGLITLERLGKLKEKVERDFIRLTQELKEGRIEAEPLKDGRKLDPCRYCEMKALCKNGRCTERPYRFGVPAEEIFGEEE